TPTSDTTPDVVITVEDGAGWEIKNGETVLVTGIGTGAEQNVTLSELGEGTYNLTLVATDEAKNTTTVNLSEFTIDLSVSPISLSTLPNNPTNETTADITVSGDDIVFYKYKLDGSDYGGEIAINTNIVLSGLSEGEHTISVKGRDEAGNWSDEISETWTVDLTIPVIVLLGDDPANLFVGDEYEDAGATASDNIDGDITANIETANSVDTTTAGTYTVIYNVSDEAGNPADEITRTVNVSEIILESIAITNSATKLIYTVGEELDITGLEITGIYNNETTQIETITAEYITGFDSSAPVDDQVLTITVEDKTTTYAVDIISALDTDTTPPTITLLGDDPVNLEVGDEYTDAGATTLDDVDGDITAAIVIVNPVDTTTAGTYIITYNVSDSAGNSADEITRTVIINEAPIPTCGDGTCNGDETCSSCSADCGSCPSSGGGGYTPPSNPSSVNSPLKVSSSQTGTLTQNLNNENKIKLEVPKGSIKSKTTFTASEGSLEEGNVPENKIGAFLFNGLVFNIEAVDANKKVVREFSKDLMITLTVPDLPDDTTSLELYYFDDEKEEWIIITDIEFGDNTISFKVNHLTQFAVFEINKIKELKQGKVTVLGVEANYREIQLRQILTDANDTWKGDVNSVIVNAGAKRNLAKEADGANKYTQPLIKGILNLTAENKNAITNFVVYGTKGTQILGAGERAGVINSYKSAFGKLPTTQSEWEDVIKIANGRWPSEKNQAIEEKAKQEFKKVYLRDPDMDNPNDNAAVTVIAYGLRPSDRNLDSEKAGIIIFKAIYGYNPFSAADWDIARAIAYSGAER
ncbi:DUF5011 domain-containing protein, partial [Candidatus Parcubacteria bacterium]|nr:DUF5011 domain-containing protein [Candidatus Parcubacteria bacterium]